MYQLWNKRQSPLVLHAWKVRHEHMIWPTCRPEYQEAQHGFHPATMGELWIEASLISYESRFEIESTREIKFQAIGCQISGLWNNMLKQLT